MSLELSILVPTYNRARYLDRCLTLFAETALPFNKFEVLILNDGSTDETPFICHKWKKHGLPIKLLSCPKPHLGRNAALARNVGIRKATGKVLAQTEPELLFNIDFPKVMLDVFEPSKIKIAEKWCKLEIHHQNRIDAFWPKVAKHYEKHRAKFKLPHLQQSYPNPHTGCMLREHLVAIRGYDERFLVWGGEDDDLVARLSTRKVTIERIPGYYIIHQWHPSLQNIVREEYQKQFELIEKSKKNPDPVRNKENWGTHWGKL